jgi:hypothetical protein
MDTLDNFREYDEVVLRGIGDILSTMEYEDIDKFIERYDTVYRGTLYNCYIAPCNSKEYAVMLQFYYLEVYPHDRKSLILQARFLFIASKCILI